LYWVPFCLGRKSLSFLGEERQKYIKNKELRKKKLGCEMNAIKRKYD
jgi:hypothetical protein